MPNRYFFLLLFIAIAALAQEYDPAAKIRQGQPKPVAVLIDRIVDCNHLGGEEGYDADRVKEITAAATKLRCNQIEQDEAALVKKYHGDKKVTKALAEAHETYP